MNEYPAAVGQLLTMGAIDPGEDSPEYRDLGIGPEHIPDLIRMLEDVALLKADSRRRNRRNAIARRSEPRHGIRSIWHVSS